MRRKIRNITDLLKSKIRRAEWNVVGLPIYSDVLLAVILDSEIDLQNLLIKIFSFVKNMLEKQEMIMKINETSLKRTISLFRLRKYCTKNLVGLGLLCLGVNLTTSCSTEVSSETHQAIFQNLLICNLFCNFRNDSSKYCDWLWKKVTAR